VQLELFRPSLTYPVHPYDEMLTRTAERYPEHVAVVSKEVNLIKGLCPQSYGST
jgi:hypothetical protein